MLPLSINTDKLLTLLQFDKANPLLFNSGLFLLLFCGFIVIYQLMRKYHIAKMIFVILFSLYFYYKSSAEYCFILLGVCVSDYLLGLLMGECHKNWQRRGVVWINVLMNVGMLVYFKYLNLIFETICNFASRDFDAFDIILPAGISFFTFRSISYIVDIYRREIEPCRDFLAYTFYLTFFPPLLAGPVVRAKDMLPQVTQNPEATRPMVAEGLFLIMCGLVKKVVVADFISQNFVDRIFDNPALYSGFENLMGMYGFLIQLYCDFSGYSDMAIGIALLLGFRFLDNFRAPFKAQNPTEFWHRWHISLSSWLRDYIYIPLGGNRCGKLRHHSNLMTTMVVGGLWHGASWMYLIWGALQGVFLVGHKVMFGGRKKKASDAPRWRVVLNVFLTFNLLAISFVFFRARSLDVVRDMATQIFTNFHPGVIPQFVSGYLMIVLLMVGALVLHFLPTHWSEKTRKRYEAMPLIVQGLILAIVIFIVIQARQSDIMPFIYFQY
ncbi:MAG: MBOAT family protein [Firmicutes bacterium]|nr:MBOAT family protein [Bacillota bacterium]MCM1402006.1 MBOAT family protein [Bacteroides sp.]MCM1477936.1 MBOAT family protein [Bacteroides sp.]